MSSQSKKTNILFTIDVKVSGQTISVPVYDGENHEQLVKRFCEQHIFKSDYQQAIKDKIIQALLATLKKAQISAALKKKVNNFLAVHQNISQPKSKQKSQKSLKANSNASTPFKMLPQHSNPSHSHRVNSNQHIGGHAQAKVQKFKQKQRSLKQVQIKPYQKPKCIKKNNTEVSKPTIPVAVLHPSKSRTSASRVQDQDLIAAYQTILKKSKQPQIKVMAKKYLQQHGFAKPTKNISSLNRKSGSNSILAYKKQQQNQISKQIGPYQTISQQGNNNNSYIHSLTKFQIVEPPHFTRSPQNLKNTPSRVQEHKNRIKYDIDGKSIDIAQFNHEAAPFSRYQQQLQAQSYRVPRASVSYSRLPYNYLQTQNYDDQPSFRNSRLSRDYQPDRAISLRRTRKYKYL